MIDQALAAKPPSISNVFDRFVYAKVKMREPILTFHK